MTNDETRNNGMSRRDFVKIGLLFSAAAAATTTGVVLFASRPGPLPRLVAPSPILYTRFPTDQWWNDRAGQPVRVTDFQEWQGATGVWRAAMSDGQPVPGSGYPVLVIRVKRDDAFFAAPGPDEFPLPMGFHLYYDDPTRDIRVVAVFDRSTHLCCYPGWHVVTNPPPARDYIAPTPTYEVYRQDPIYDVCHGGQWDPMILEWGSNPRSGINYIGARMVHGPGFGPLPIVPLRADDDVLSGGNESTVWYQYC